MFGANEGRLLWKKEVQNKFGEIIMNAADKGSFTLGVSVKGIRLPVLVRIYVDIIQEDYVQVRDRYIEDTPVSLGEKRLDALWDAVTKVLYQDPHLFAPIEHTDGFVYGAHYHFHQSYYRNKAITLQQKKRSKLELLATEVIEKEGKRVNLHYFYDETNQTLLEGIADSWLEETWAANNTLHVLRQLYTKRYDVARFAVDENGVFYKVSFVPDPVNIRLFTVNQNEFRSEIHSLHNSRKRMEYFTYEEALEVTVRSENRSPKPVDITLPYTSGQLTLHSSRVLGSSMTNYPIGTFVRSQLGHIGVTTSLRKGKSYEVCWQDAYLANDQLFAQNELEPIENPYQKRTDAPLVQYRFQTPHDWYYGFGYLLEERPSVYKIKPVAKYQVETAFTLQKMVVSNLRYNQWTTAETIAKMKEIHGEDLDFLLIPTEQVTLLDVVQTKAVQSFLAEKVPSTEEQIFTNLLSLTDVRRLNWDYLLFSLVDYSSYISLAAMMKKITELMLLHKHSNFVEACITWFDVLEAKKRLTVA